MKMISTYIATNYKIGTSTGFPHWDITFNDADFQTISGYAWLEGPFSLILDIDATAALYPVYFGIELVGISGSVSITDSAQIAFCPRGERKTISSGSVPQLAHIIGTFNKIIIHCYGYSAGEALLTKVALRIGPPRPIADTPAFIGRATMANEPGMYGTATGSLVATGGMIDGTLFQLEVPQANGIRFRFVSINIIIPPTPSYAGDIEVLLVLTDRYGATFAILAFLRSELEKYTSFIFPHEFIFDVGYTLQATVSNYNPALAYTVRYTITYQEIY
jgi:hypothetical protein